MQNDMCLDSPVSRQLLQSGLDLPSFRARDVQLLDFCSQPELTLHYIEQLTSVKYLLFTLANLE